MSDDDDENESERLQWRLDYHATFVMYALSRSGWDRINAETWASEIVDDALIAYFPNLDAITAAKRDVLLCEQETQDTP